MNPSDPPPGNPPQIVAPRSYRLLRRLTWLYAIAFLVVGALLSFALLPPNLLPRTRELALEAVAGGLGGIVAPALLLALTVLAGTFAITVARYRYKEQAPEGGDAQAAPRTVWSLATLSPGWVARAGQAVIVTTGAVAVYVAAGLLWPQSLAATAPASANVVAAFVFALAFIVLVTERTMAAFPAPLLPEAPALRTVLLLTTLLLLAAACLELGRGFDLTWLHWVAVALVCVPCAVVLELAVRALARLFLPAPQSAQATAVTSSLLAGLFTGGPRAPAVLLKTHFGLDFARSWALSYLSAALLPAVFITALFCWGLSGLKLIDLDQRGVYERFGAPVAVLGPGLHLLLPWPLGRLRPVEYGAIHSVAIGVDQMDHGEDSAIAAEALPPDSLNRLWESSHPGQANYLVPSVSTSQQGFQTVSTEISVLYRVGLTDAQALQSVYTVAAPEDLVKEAASRLVLRYFNSRTLEEVLGARRENIADALRAALIADLRSYDAGIDVVSVLIEEIHPPAGAAAAYHAVQAAQINASASIADETARAKRVAGIAEQEAHQLTAAATAQADETLHAANAEAYQFGADRHAYDLGGRSFLLERSFSNLKKALGQNPLTIVDHRLNPAQAPIMDLRSQPQSGPGPSMVLFPAANQPAASQAPANPPAATPPAVPPGPAPSASEEPN
jgi:regulator of protease activity HflC (stomatin/prohibitin superfamily)